MQLLQRRASCGAIPEDGDDAVRSWHFHAQETIVDGCHETIEEWVTEDGVVGELKLRHCKLNVLGLEVVRGSKSDGQGARPYWKKIASGSTPLKSGARVSLTFEIWS